jgi:hypothetical protein
MSRTGEKDRLPTISRMASKWTLSSPPPACCIYSSNVVRLDGGTSDVA